MAIIVMEFMYYRNIEENTFGISLNEQNIDLDAEINKENNGSYQILEFKNNHNYSVRITTEDIILECKGYGPTKEADEELVKNNYEIEVSFSKEKDGKKEDDILLDKNDTAYIHVNTYYKDAVYPTNRVGCNYSININSN